jgi:thiamine kinase
MPGSDIERIARSCVPGTGAIGLERLGSGLVNVSYRVVRDHHRYSLRVPLAEAAELGADSAWECRVLEQAAAAGIAPRIACCEPRLKILVTRWVDGRAWTPEEACHAENLEKMALLLRRVHALPTPAAPRIMTPAAWIAYYRKTLVDRGASTAHPLSAAGRYGDLERGLESRLAALDELPPPQRVLCHSDLHRQNLVAADRALVLLDWEYCHVSEPCWDLAGWACNNDLGAEARRLLQTRYLGRAPSAEDCRRLESLAWLYDYVCLLWSELYLNLRGGSAADGILTRAQELAMRLLSESGSRAG